MIISLVDAICRNHVHIIVCEGFRDNHLTIYMSKIPEKLGMEERSKSVRIDEDSYKIVQNVVTNSTADFRGSSVQFVVSVKTVSVKNIFLRHI